MTDKVEVYKDTHLLYKKGLYRTITPPALLNGRRERPPVRPGVTMRKAGHDEETMLRRLQKFNNPRHMQRHDRLLPLRTLQEPQRLP